jgi:peroxiredoxin
MNTDRDTLESVKNFVSQYSLPFPNLLDNKGNVDDLYHVSFFPTSFLIDRNGKIVDVIHLLDEKELDRKITKLING